ncbi:MAG: phosphate ABC transporter permease subunit PstC [Armatimonadetes bacterium]|nr:phosphate ABC transporter permease subunit PstC [Armatimonadota bacterium]
MFLMVGAVLYYLGHEGRYAFDRKFDYGFRFAAQSTLTTPEPLDQDPNATVVASSPDATQGPDDKEAGLMMPTIAELAGGAQVVTGASLTADPTKTDPEQLFRDDWRPSTTADVSESALIYVCATPEYKGQTMKLAWKPDVDFEPSSSPRKYILSQVSGPGYEEFKPVDLTRTAEGAIEIETYRANTDADRTKGYVFKLDIVPNMGQNAAVLTDFFSTRWLTGVTHVRYGVMPLLLSTLAMTVLAVLMAIPISFVTAGYIREFASDRVRGWLKPTIELLASIPTVVLGYFGLTLLGPKIQGLFGGILQMDNPRSLLTASVVLSFLLVPTITTLAEEALNNVPNSIRDAGDGLGLTRWEALRQIIFPAAKGGLIAAVMFGFARAIGETIIIWMLSGGTPHMPGVNLATLGGSTRGISDTIGIELGNVDFEGVHYGHLYLLGLTLFLLTLAFNSLGYKLARRAAWRQ